MQPDTAVIDEKINELFSFLINTSKYKSPLLFTINAKLYDICIIILWKCLMLFFYERISQIETSKKCELWDKKFNSKNGNHLANDVNCENLYWPNVYKDDQLIEYIKGIYNIDSNLITQIRILLFERNTCAHVSELETVKNEFLSFLDKSLRIMNNLQIAHFVYLEEYAKSGFAFSSKDALQVLPIKIFELTQAATFDEAEAAEKKLEFYIPSFSEAILTNLIEGIFANKYNQVLGANYTKVFIRKLFNKTSNYYKCWEKFLEKINTYNEKERYQELINDIVERITPF